MRMRLPKLHVSQWLAMISGGLVVSGLVCIGLYASSTAGPHVRYAGVGLITAFAAFLSGCLFGFLFGIPKVVSSGQLRQVKMERPIVTETTTDTTKTTTMSLPPQTRAGQTLEAESSVPPLPAEDAGAAAGSVPQPAGPTGTAPPRNGAPGSEAPLTFEPSSNLAEVSDWLTKLLLGAGLVSLTKLGEPLGALVTSVAAGLETSASVSGPARTMAGAILLSYSTLGFLDGYVVTTLWYGKRLGA